MASTPPGSPASSAQPAPGQYFSNPDRSSQSSKVLLHSNMSANDLRLWMRHAPKVCAAFDKLLVDLRMGHFHVPAEKHLPQHGGNDPFSFVMSAPPSSKSSQRNSSATLPPSDSSDPADNDQDGASHDAASEFDFDPESDPLPGAPNTARRNRHATSRHILDFLKTLIGSTRWVTPCDLLNLLLVTGRELHYADAGCHIVGGGGTGQGDVALTNLLRRVMKKLRDEVEEIAEQGDRKKKSGGEATAKSKKKEKIGGATPPTSPPRMTPNGTMLNPPAPPPEIRMPLPMKRGISGMSLNLMTDSAHTHGPSPYGGDYGGQLYAQAARFRSNSISSSAGEGGSPRESPTLSSSSHQHVSPNVPLYRNNKLHDSFYIPAVGIALKPNLMESLCELQSEFVDMHKQINDQALHHIHPDSIVLVYGCGSSHKNHISTIEGFLLSARMGHGSKKGGGRRNFTVLVVESDSSSDHASSSTPITASTSRMVVRLCSAGIPVTVLPFSQLFALMSRVHLLLLPATTVLANGGLITPSGGHLAALAAERHRVPVLCLTSMAVKLSPTFPHRGQCTMQALQGGPLDLVTAGFVAGETGELLDSLNPAFDYVPPRLITLYVTNSGGVAPSYVYRLLSDFYCPEDPVSFEE